MVDNLGMTLTPDSMISLYQGQPKSPRYTDPGLVLGGRLGGSRMVTYTWRIAELDLNPVLVHEKGATIVDARIRLEPSH